MAQPDRRDGAAASADGAGQRPPNGRRQPRIGGESPGINQVPAPLIELVEVLTGGASAAYRSDAVAGVVSFIMKGDFEDIQPDAKQSFPSHASDVAYVMDYWVSSRR